MKLWIVFLFSTICFSQTLVKSSVDKFVGVDIYENIYTLKNGALHKSNLDNDYVNINYGTPDDIDISDPLRVLLLYKLFNTVVLLDNRLNFISEFKVPFGSQFIANAGKNKVWLYNQVDLVLSIFNFTTQKTEAVSIPITNKITRLKGNLNKAVTVDTQEELVTYNFVARKSESKSVKSGLTSISLFDDFVIKNNMLYNKNKLIYQCPKNIKAFEVVNNTFYFLKDEGIYTINLNN
ncbi:hypothetical protein ACXGQW_03785 [Wenyingzhuangia sp. IMCC45533]